MMPSNVQNFAMKPLISSLWFTGLNIFNITSLLYKSADDGKLWSIC